MVLEIIEDKRSMPSTRWTATHDPEAKAIVLAVYYAGADQGHPLSPVTRLAGIFTAGTAQRYVNMEGYMVGKRVVILGSETSV